MTFMSSVHHSDPRGLTRTLRLRPPVSSVSRNCRTCFAEVSLGGGGMFMVMVDGGETALKRLTRVSQSVSRSTHQHPIL